MYQSESSVKTSEDQFSCRWEARALIPGLGSCYWSTVDGRTLIFTWGYSLLRDCSKKKMSVLRVTGSSSSFSSAGRAEKLQSPSLSLPSWQHTWGLLTTAAAVRVCGRPWRSQSSVPWVPGELSAAMWGASEEQSLGDVSPWRPQSPLGGLRCGLSCSVSWPVCHWMAPFLAELAISSLIKCLCFSSPEERENGHPLAGRKDICCSPHRGL